MSPIMTVVDEAISLLIATKINHHMCLTNMVTRVTQTHTVVLYAKRIHHCRNNSLLILYALKTSMCLVQVYTMPWMGTYGWVYT